MIVMFISGCPMAKADLVTEAGKSLEGIGYRE